MSGCKAAPALDAHQGRAAAAAQQAPRIERLADERREALAHARRSGQHHQQSRLRLEPHALATPLGDAVELLLRVGGANHARAALSRGS